MEQVAVETSLPIDDLPPKQRGYALLRAQGLNQTEAAASVGLTKGMGTYLERKLKPKYDLTSPKYLKLAATAIKETLALAPREDRQTVLDKEGKLVDVVERIYPSHTNRLAAAQMVYDRAQPIKTRDDDLPAVAPLPISITMLYGGERAAVQVTQGNFTSLQPQGLTEVSIVDK